MLGDAILENRKRMYDVDEKPHQKTLASTNTNGMKQYGYMLDLKEKQQNYLYVRQLPISKILPNFLCYKEKQ